MLLIFSACQIDEGPEPIDTIEDTSQEYIIEAIDAIPPKIIQGRAYFPNYKVFANFYGAIVNKDIRAVRKLNLRGNSNFST